MVLSCLKGFCDHILCGFSFFFLSLFAKCSLAANNESCLPEEHVPPRQHCKPCFCCRLGCILKLEGWPFIRSHLEDLLVILIIWILQNWMGKLLLCCNGMIFYEFIGYRKNERIYYTKYACCLLRCSR